VIVTGFPRSGTTLLYCMLRYAVEGYQFLDHESWAPRPGHILKSVRAVFEAPAELIRGALVMVRDPREILCSVYHFGPYHDQPYVSAHSTLKWKDRGLCEWWAAIKMIQDAHLIRYEDLVADPCKVQLELADRFEYRPGRYFDEFHLESHGEMWEGAMNGRRAPAHSRKLDIARLEEQFRLYPELHDVCAEMGYGGHRAAA